MKCIRKCLLILGLIFLLGFSLSGCIDDYDVIAIQLKMDVSDVVPGGSYPIITNVYINDELSVNHGYNIIYSVESGTDYVQFNSDNTLIYISQNAPVGESITLSVTYGEIVERYTLSIVKKPVESVILKADSKNAIINSDVQLQTDIYPNSATYKDVEYIIVEGKEYVDIIDNSMYIKQNSPIGGEVIIRAVVDGVESNDISLIIDYIPVESISIWEESHNYSVMQGGSLQFKSSYLPLDATYNEIKYCIESEYEIHIDEDTGLLNVPAEVPWDCQFYVYACMGDIRSESLTITVIRLDIEGIVLSADNSAVAIGEKIELFYEILPYSVEGVCIGYEIISGTEYAELLDNTILTKSYTPSGALVSVIAYLYDNEGKIEGIESNIIEISVFKVDVCEVTLTTSDNVEMVGADQTIMFDVNIYPSNATNKTATYYIKEGSSFADINRDTGVLRVFKNNENQEVKVFAIVDGVTSDIFVVTTAMYYYDVTLQADWNYFDISGNSFRNYRNIIFNLNSLSNDADLTTIVIPSYVKRLQIIGAYSQVSPIVTTNLFFFFYNCSEIEITLRDVGIETTAYSNANIFDLPEGSSAKFIIEGLSFIKAGNTIDPHYYSIDGVYESGDSNFELKKHGMPGRNGAHGGTAIMGYNLTFKGNGKMYVQGGDGANGTKGGNGADIPSGITNGIAGNGGQGGSGGDSGYAIYGLNIIIDLSKDGVINASSGNAGKGGIGGARGTSPTPAGNHGMEGERGYDGRVFLAIVAYNLLSPLSGNVYESKGRVNPTGWTIPEHESIQQLVLRIEKTYATKMRIMNDFETVGEYHITKLINETDVLYMLRTIDNVLSKFPTNIFRELWRMTGSQVNIFSVNAIEKGSIAGLAGRNTNRVWLAHCRPAIRNIFYSDVENFAFHELMHLLKYPIENRFDENILKQKNNNERYNGSSPVGVYNPQSGYGKYNSYFLSSYSRTHWYEDVCETFSLIARLSVYYDFLDADAPIRDKMIYISTRLSEGYGTCGTYKDEYWERFLSGRYAA